MSIFSDVHDIALTVHSIKDDNDEALAALPELSGQITELLEKLDRLIEIGTHIQKCLCSDVVGIAIKPGVPTPHTKGPSIMGSIKLVKKSGLKKSAGKPGPVKAGDFILVDNQDDTCTVQGTDAGGNPVDISSVATITAASSDTSKLTVDPPSGMTFAMHAVGPLGHSDVTVVATWNDGSIGPFTATLPVDIIAGGPTGIQIVPGTPTVH